MSGKRLATFSALSTGTQLMLSKEVDEFLGANGLGESCKIRDFLLENDARSVDDIALLTAEDLAELPAVPRRKLLNAIAELRGVEVTVTRVCRGYGFARTADGEDVYVYRSSFRPQAAFASLAEGDVLKVKLSPPKHGVCREAKETSVLKKREPAPEAVPEAPPSSRREKARLVCAKVTRKIKESGFLFAKGQTKEGKQEDFYVHASSFKSMADFDKLQEDGTIEFEPVAASRGVCREARGVEVVEKCDVGKPLTPKGSWRREERSSPTGVATGFSRNGCGAQRTWRSGAALHKTRSLPTWRSSAMVA